MFPDFKEGQAMTTPGLRRLVAAGAATLLISAATLPSASAMRTRASHTTITMWVRTFSPNKSNAPTPQAPVAHRGLEILAQKFEAANPGVTINLIPAQDVPDNTDQIDAWMTARNAAGTVPEIVSSIWGLAVQRGWCVPLDQYLNAPNPYVPGNKHWIDLFYPKIQAGMKFPDGHYYNLPFATQFPGLVVMLAANQNVLKQAGVGAPTSWTNEIAVAKALKDKGLGGVSPWPTEAAEGNLWPIGYQLGPALFQSLGPMLDTNHDGTISAKEASTALVSGKLSVKTPQLREMWKQMYNLAQQWTPGWQTTDLDLLFRQGKLGLQYQGYWELVSLLSDPSLKFNRTMVPVPYLTPKDDPLASAPLRWTAGNGKVPADAIQYNLPATVDACISKSAVKAHNDLAMTIKWLQYIFSPSTLAFIVNEYGEGIPAIQGTPLNPAWQLAAKYRYPVYKYSVVEASVGFFLDNAQWRDTRKLFVSWLTGQISESTFFSKLEQSMVAGAKRVLQSSSNS